MGAVGQCLQPHEVREQHEEFVKVLGHPDEIEAVPPGEGQG